MSIPLIANDSRAYQYRRSQSRTASYERGYDWPRLHAAAIDRRFEGPDGNKTEAPAQQIHKRIFDIVVSATLIAILSPLLVTIAALLWKESRSVLFGHRRVGADGRPFLCWKFRTMVPDAEKVLKDLLATDPVARAEWEHDFKLRNDPRVTRLGHFLRVTSLDELPQLFNVLFGDMSIVGPRPIITDEIKRYGAAYHDYLQCRPGITGVWQVSGRNDTGYKERVRIDQGYARNWSFWTDCLILLKTPMAVLRRSGAY